MDERRGGACAGGVGNGARAVTFATNGWMGWRPVDESAIALFSVLHDPDS